jgi:hypothetical protein
MSLPRSTKRQRMEVAPAEDPAVAVNPSAPSLAVAVGPAVAAGPAVDRERALQDARCAVIGLATSATSTGLETALNKLSTAIEARCARECPCGAVPVGA